MTRYLIYQNIASADVRSRAAWTPGQGDNITIRLWDIREHPIDGRGALIIPDGYEDKLTEEERGNLIDSLTDDWFGENYE